MKLLPYYIEDDGAKFSGALSLYDNVNVLSEEDACLISDYMDTCVVISEWGTSVKNIMTNTFSIPLRKYSDGLYVWEQSHIYYVKKYRARLPLDFIAHVKKQIEIQFNPKSVDEEKSLSEYEKVLEKKADGDESFYDGSY